MILGDGRLPRLTSVRPVRQSILHEIYFAEGYQPHIEPTSSGAVSQLTMDDIARERVPAGRVAALVKTAGDNAGADFTRVP